MKTMVFAPAWNEEEVIAEVIEEIQQEIPYAAIVVIDDGSVDETTKRAKEKGAEVISFPVNRGLEKAIATGYKHAAAEGFDYCGRVDGDGQHPAKELKKLLAAVEGDVCDIAVGSRFLSSRPPYKSKPERVFGMGLVRLLMSIRLRRPMTDSMSGMYAVNRKGIELLADDYVCRAPEVEGLLRIKEAELRLVEIPVEMRERLTGQSSFNFKRSIALVATIGATIFFEEYLRRRHQRQESAAKRIWQQLNKPL